MDRNTIESAEQGGIFCDTIDKVDSGVTVWYMGRRATERELAILKLRMERIDAGFSQRALADKAKVSHVTIKRLEEGDLPSPRVALAVAQVFKKKPSDIWPELVKGTAEESAA